jgi:hypothetical protein
MNLNTITQVKRPTSPDEIPEWHEGCAWLAGGTWLFSTPQNATHTLIDLETLRWRARGLPRRIGNRRDLHHRRARVVPRAAGMDRRSTAQAVLPCAFDIGQDL